MPPSVLHQRINFLRISNNCQLLPLRPSASGETSPAANGSHSVVTQKLTVGRRTNREVKRRAETENLKISAAVDDVTRGKLDEKTQQGKATIIEAPSRDNDDRTRSKLKPLVQEKVTSSLLRRYWSDGRSGALRVEETNAIEVDVQGEGNQADVDAKTKPLLLPLGLSLPKVVADFVLPAGFPDSVSSDYLRYMLWQFPTNITGWICSTLVTSSLFKAVGVGVPGEYAAAATATIKWVTKDGLGALGLILIGGRFGGIFDEDPKQWRLYADFIGSAGSIFELATPLAPGQFLLLGSLGYLFKAIAKGLKDPSFRVIQNHFAISKNLGDVSAKEEVWEVSAKLLGLAVAVLFLGLPGLNNSYWELLLLWTSLRLLHLWLRYQSLAGVQLPTINYKRAALLIQSHLQGHKLPGCEECNGMENLLVWWQLVSPRVRVGCSLKDVLEPSPSALEMEELLTVYSNEDYLLVLHPSTTHGVEACILAKEGVTSTSILRSLWQAYWLFSPSVAVSRSSPNSEDYSTVSDSLEETVGSGSLSGQLLKLTKSLEAMNHHFDSFLTELQGSGWDLDKIILKLPRNAPTIIA